MNDWTKERYTSGDSLFTKTFFGCQYRKKAPLAGEATRLFNYLTVMKLSLLAHLRTLTAAYIQIVAKWIKEVNPLFADVFTLATRLRSLNAFCSG